MKISRPWAALAASILTFAPVFLARDAAAIDTCRIAADRKTGLITMSGTNLTGLFGWRDSAGDAIQAFDMTNCEIDGNDVVKCPLAPADDKRATVPPPSCKVCIADGSGKECCAGLKGCTPGMRDCLSVYANTSLDPMSFGSVEAVCPVGYTVTGGGITNSDFQSRRTIYTSRPTDGQSKGWFCEGYNEYAPFTSVMTCVARCCRMP